MNAILTPTDQATYATATKPVTIVVNLGGNLAYSNLTQTHAASTLSPTLTTSAAGLTFVNTIFNGVHNLN